MKLGTIQLDLIDDEDCFAEDVSDDTLNKPELCTGDLCKIFSIPMGTNTIWLNIYTEPAKHRVAFVVRHLINGRPNLRWYTFRVFSQEGKKETLLCLVPEMVNWIRSVTPNCDQAYYAEIEYNE